MHGLASGSWNTYTLSDKKTAALTPASMPFEPHVAHLHSPGRLTWRRSQRRRLRRFSSCHPPQKRSGVRRSRHTLCFSLAWATRDQLDLCGHVASTLYPAMRSPVHWAHVSAAGLACQPRLSALAAILTRGEWLHGSCLPSTTHFRRRD